MTMTDTEAKALALVNDTARAMEGPLTLHPADHVYYTELPKLDVFANALCRVIEREAATEARHAAELRELKERFREVAARADDALAFHGYRPDGGCRHALAPFILPAPDPLVELAREMTLLDGVVRTDNQKAAIREGRAGNTASDDFYDRLRTALASRQYEVRKIGEAGE